MDTSTPQNSADPTDRDTLGGFGYGIGLAVAVIIMFVIIAYVSYVCKRIHVGTTAVLNHGGLINGITYHDPSIVVITINGHDGVDEETLATYPRFSYSEARAYKSGSEESSVCSICLADYKDADLVRLLPNCGHPFHVVCIDPWLLLHSTCPVCRKSPVPTPVATTAQVNVM